MKQRVIIKWKIGIDYVQNPPFVESFFTKTPDSAQKLVDRRSKRNMESATFQGINLLK